jgi:hypothetical protein
LSDEPGGNLVLEPFLGSAVIGGVLFDKDETPVAVPRSHAGRAGPREGVFCGLGHYVAANLFVRGGRDLGRTKAT